MRGLKSFITNQSGKVYVKFFIWPSIVLSLLLTVLLNLLFHH
jgi:hypothetical protein